MLPTIGYAKRLPGRRRTLAVLLAFVTGLSLAVAAEVGSSTAKLQSDRQSMATLGLFGDTAPTRAREKSEGRPVELGVRFRVHVTGRVTGAQVYKISEGRRATPRRASLWNSNGRRLATVRFDRARGAGWVDARFSTPVVVRAGRIYTVSVFAPRGRYAVTPRGLREPQGNTALKTIGRRNGVFRYAAVSRFPKESHRSSNYWVDVVFQARGGATPTPSPTPTNTPTATPTQTPTGFPNASNTGVPAGVTLTPYSGPMTITTNGTVIDAKEIKGALQVRAQNVTITRSSVAGTVDVGSSASLSISDVLIDAGDVAVTGLEGYNFTAERVHVIGGNRSMHCIGSCTIRDSYVHGQMTDETGVAHESGIRMEQHTTLIHNTIGCDAPTIPPDAGCSAGLTGYGDFMPVQDNLIQNNLFLPTTGGTCAYGGSSQGKPYSDGARDILFIDNVFSRGRTRKCGYWFPIADFDRSAPGNVWQNNVWEDGGAVRP